MILDGTQRRKAIIEYLSTHTSPVSGTQLASYFGVSRQVIVQDIALLRAKDRNILSTNKGYILYHPLDTSSNCTALICVRHSAEQTLEEMRTIVEYGGQMLDVFIDHDLYGQLRADLVIHTIEDAEEFCTKMLSSKSKPLKELTEDYHYHTISAPSKKVLDLIKKELLEKGFLVEEDKRR